MSALQEADSLVGVVPVRGEAPSLSGMSALRTELSSLQSWWCSLEAVWDKSLRIMIVPSVRSFTQTVIVSPSGVTL